MPADLHDAPPAASAPDLDPQALHALRGLAVACAGQTETSGVLQVLRSGAGALEGADALEVALDDREPASPLGELAGRARRTGRVAVSADRTGRAVAVPMRVRGEPAALALGWSQDPGAGRARALAAALAEQAAVALEAAGRFAELRDAALRRDRFFSAMSHDLRTPITAIVGYSELLQDGIVGALDARQQEMVERICQVSGELSQLVTDMLDLAKLDAGRMEFHRESATLPALVDAAIDAVEAQLAASGAQVSREAGEPGAPLRVDRARVRQVLGNLIAHAAHAAPGGTVAVTTGRDRDAAWVQVADRGPTPEPGDGEALFDPLPPGAGRTGRAGPGAALSLALSRRIARAMGGEVDVRPRPGGGAVLTLQLPG